LTYRRATLAPERKVRLPNPWSCLFSGLLWNYRRPMSVEEPVHLLARLHARKEQKKREDAIWTIVQEPAERARREGYERGLVDGKRGAVN